MKNISKNIKKLIIGLILGLILAFVGFIETPKVKAAVISPITSLDDIPIGAVITFDNHGIETSSLPNGSRINNNPSSGTFTSGYEAFNNSYLGLVFYNNDSMKLYINDSFTSWYEDEGFVNGVNYLTVTGDLYYWPSYNAANYDNSDNDLIDFLNTYATISYTQPHDPFTLTLNANGGDFISIGTGDTYTTRTITTVYGDVSADVQNFLRSYDIEKDAYSFIGWNTNSSATTAMTYSQLDELNNDTTIYAIWQLSSSVLITFDSNAPSGHYIESGSAPPSEYILQNTNYVLPGNTGNMSISGFTFIGWATSPTATTALSSYNVGTNDVTFYAVWRENVVYYTVNFNGNGAEAGTTPTSQTVARGATITIPGNPGHLEKSGFLFLGWATSSTATQPITAQTYQVNSNVTFYAVWQEMATNYMRFDVSINGTIRGSYYMIKQSGSTYSLRLSGLSNGLFEISFYNINYLDKITENSQYILMSGNNNVVFGFNGDFIENLYIYVNGDLSDYGTYDELLTIEDEWTQYPYYEGVTLLIEIETDEEINTPIISFKNVVKTVFDSVQTLLNLQFGWFTIGGIVAIVLAIGVIFFVFKIVRGGN